MARAANGALKVGNASGEAGRLHVPVDIKKALDQHLPNALFTVSLTEEGILYKLIPEPKDVPVADLPAWLQGAVAKKD